MSTQQLRKAMGFRDLVLFYVVTALSLRWIATAAAAGPSSLLVWFIGCFTFFIPLVFCVLELSSRFPEEGGLYAWSKHAFGDGAGFMTGWLYWACNLPYYPAVLYFAAANALFVDSSRLQHLSERSSYFIIVALAGLLLGVVLNVIGLNIGKWLHNFGALGAWIPALLLIGMGVFAWWSFGPATPINVKSMLPGAGIKDLVFWSTIAFAFGGFEGASVMGGEIRDARRNIPRAVLTAGVIVTLMYTAGTAAVLLALPAGEVSGLQGVMQAISGVANRIGVGAVVPLTAALITLSSIGAVSAWFAASARLPFVAGLDRFLPAAFGRLHPKWKTPYVALIVQGVIAAVFIFLGQAGTSVKGAYDVLVSMGVISYFLPFLFMFTALIRVQKERAGPDVIRVPGGAPAAIVLALIGLATTVVSIVLALIPSADEANPFLAVLKVVGLSVLMVAIGALIYVMGRSGRTVDASSSMATKIDIY